MNRSVDRVGNYLEYGIPWLVLSILLFYSYVTFLRHPFGFAWLPQGNIVRIFVRQPEPTLMVGDYIKQVGTLSWDDFRADLRRSLFEDVKIGEVTPVVVERNGQTITILWRLPGFNLGEFIDQLIAQWFLAYFFWLAGLLTFLLLRPKDERWWLLTAFNFLTAIWLIAGSGPSNYQLWYSALVLRVTIWLSVPVYLHLHWVFPRPLGKLSPILIWLVYGFALVLAIAQWFQLFSRDLYFLGFLIAILGSLILLIVHYFQQPEVRREIQILVTIVLFAFLPTIIMTVVFTLIQPKTELVTLAFISFTTIPFAYLYVAYRRQLGGLEMRVNRLVSIYFFVMLLVVINLPLLAASDFVLPTENKVLIVGSLTVLTTLILSIWGFPRFQKFVEQRILGIPASPDQIQGVYSARTTASTSINALTDMLKDVVLPSLLARQFLFVQFEVGIPKVLLAVGLDEKQVSGDAIVGLSALANGDLDANPKVRPFPWVRLSLPLVVGADVIGLWLFGKRDPDDFYSQQELPMLRSLANQTAIALSNILQTERLHAAFQDSIRRDEQARQQLALELHDSVLNKMAALMMKLDDQSLTPQFQKSYSELTDQVRELVRDLRPAMLSYGLRSAIDDYVETLADRVEGTVQFAIDLASNGHRYPDDVEQHTFRILQEACANALKHAQATRISISGRLEKDLIELSVQDNGKGFDPAEKLDLTSMQASGHFGLTGMFERAELIGATIAVRSEPEKGTSIDISWKPRMV